MSKISGIGCKLLSSVGLPQQCLLSQYTTNVNSVNYMLLSTFVLNTGNTEE